jgi:hypothetical protein
MEKYQHSEMFRETAKHFTTHILHMVKLHEIFLWPLYPSMALYPFKALCPLSDPLSPLQLSIHFMALCPCMRSVPSTVQPSVCPLHRPLPLFGISAALCSALRPSVPSTTLCPLYGPLSSLQPSVPSTALCPLYDPLPPLWPSAPLFGPLPLYPLYGSLSPLLPPVLSMRNVFLIVLLKYPSCCTK